MCIGGALEGEFQKTSKPNSDSVVSKQNPEAPQLPAPHRTTGGRGKQKEDARVGCVRGVGGEGRPAGAQPCMVPFFWGPYHIEVFMRLPGSS